MACARPADKAVCDFFDFSRLRSCPSAVPTLSSDLNWDKGGWVGEGEYVCLALSLFGAMERQDEDITGS